MKKTAKAVCALLSAALLLAGCGSSAKRETKAAAESTTTADGSTQTVVPKEKLKIGMLLIGDENEGYSASHINGLKEAAKTLGLSEDQLILKTNIREDESSLDATEDLANQGCQLIFGTSFGYESYMLEVAKNHPEITFCHASGNQAAGAGLSNFHNYFDDIFEARYVSGVAAGLKLKQMIDEGKIKADQARLGYVGAYPYAEVISGYTAFYLGAKSVVPETTMKVLYTNSWGDPAVEAETAKQLISDGCVLLSQHADTTGAPTAAEEEKVPCVGYNIDMTGVAPDSAITSPTNNWEVYYEYAIQSVLSGEPIATDWSEGFAQDAVRLTKLGTAAAPGTEEKLKEVEQKIKDGALHVFDTKTFTVNGKEVTSYAPNGQELVSDGYFHESEYRSSPSFDLIVDGIEATAN